MNADEIRKHLEVLADFGKKYGDYLMARHKREREGHSDWSSREWAEREWELRRLAPRAEAAIEASGVEGYAEMSSIILAFKDWVGFSIDARDDDLQHDILRLIPSQVAGLEMRLEEAISPARRKQGIGHRRWPPTLFGRIRHVPPILAFVADLAGTIVALVFAGHFVGLW